jgi:hypothetical protein
MVYAHQVAPGRAQTNTNDRNSKFKTGKIKAIHPKSDCNVLIIGICNFDIICNLSIAIWDFSALSGKVDRFYMNQLELTLTLPCHQSSFLDTLKGFEYTFFEVVS